MKKLTPKQKRLAQQAADQEEGKGKTARINIEKAKLLERAGLSKEPRISQPPRRSKKQPSNQKDPISIMSQMMEWCPLQADLAGEWSWKEPRQWSDQEWEANLHPKLKEFEKLTWAEIMAQVTGGKKKRHKLHHDMDVECLTAEAVTRWRNDLGLSEHETAFRFRLGNLPRLWGFRIRTKFHIVWWDRLHKIYPVD